MEAEDTDKITTNSAENEGTLPRSSEATIIFAETPKTCNTITTTISPSTAMTGIDDNVKKKADGQGVVNMDQQSCHDHIEVYATCTEDNSGKESTINMETANNTNVNESKASSATTDQVSPICIERATPILTAAAEELSVTSLLERTDQASGSRNDIKMSNIDNTPESVVINSCKESSFNSSKYDIDNTLNPNPNFPNTLIDIKSEPLELTDKRKILDDKDDVFFKSTSGQVLKNIDTVDSGNNTNSGSGNNDAFTIPRIPPEQQLMMEERLKDYCIKELRSMELSAYSECITALRAGGKIDEQKRELMNRLREIFRIPLERHQAEVRRVIANDHLAIIAENATGEDSYAEWKSEGYNNTTIEPKILSYHPSSEDRFSLTLGTIKIKYADMDEIIRPTGDLASIHCVETDHSGIDEASWVNDQDHKASIALPHDVQLNINIDNNDSEEPELDLAEIEYDAENSIRQRRKLNARNNNNETNKRKIPSRKSQTSPDITSAPSPIKKKIQTPPVLPSKPKQVTKRKLSQTKVAVSAKPVVRQEKVRKVVKSSNTQADEETSKIGPSIHSAENMCASEEENDEPRDLNAEDSNKNINDTINLQQSFRGRGRGRGRTATSSVRGRGATRGSSRGRGNSSRGQRKSGIDSSLPCLETTEEMPTSPQLVTTTKIRAKPKRKVLKIKKPTKQDKEQPLKIVTKHQRKVKLEQKDDDDYDQSLMDEQCSSSPPNKMLSPQQLQHLGHYNSMDNYSEMEKGISSSGSQSAFKPKGLTEVPAKMRHKTKHTLFTNENYESEKSEYGSSNHLPKYNFNEELQSHIKNAIANKPTASTVASPSSTTSASRILYSSSMPIPPPVFSTTLNLNNFHKKRTQLLLPSTYQNLLQGQGNNNDESSASGASASSSGVPSLTLLPAFTTASSLAAARIRPAPPPAVPSASTVLFEQQLKQQGLLVGNNNSAANVTVISAPITSLIRQSPLGDFQTPPVPIIHRKVQPHILSNSKLLRNINTQNSNIGGVINLNSIYSNIASAPNSSNVIAGCSTSSATQNTSTGSTLSTSPNSNSAIGSTVINTSPTNSPVSTNMNIQNQTPTEVIQKPPGTGFLPSNSLSTNVINRAASPIIAATSTIPLASAGSALNLATAPQGQNIIFLQKTLPMSNLSATSPVVVSSALTTVGLPSGMLPLKNTSRAVILRRTNTAAGQGNVVILDVQKNQLLNATQVPQFLQATRIVNTQADLNRSSLLSATTSNIGTTTRKIIQTSAGTLAAPIRLPKSGIELNNIQYQYQQLQQPQSPRKTRLFASPVARGGGVVNPSLRPIMAIRPLAPQAMPAIPTSFKVIVQPGNATGSTQPPPLQVVHRLLKGIPHPSEVSESNGSPGNNPTVYTDGIENNDLSDIKISYVTSTSTSGVPFTSYGTSPLIGTGTNSSSSFVPSLSYIQSADGTNIQVSEGDDIFQLALKSSGIDFSPHNFYVTESSTADSENHQSIAGTNETYVNVDPSQYATMYNEIDSNLGFDESNSTQQTGIQVPVSSGIESTQEL